MMPSQSFGELTLCILGRSSGYNLFLLFHLQKYERDEMQSTPSLLLIVSNLPVELLFLQATELTARLRIMLLKIVRHMKRNKVS